MPTLFISDLHLCAERPAITELCLDFLRREAIYADALYILGDLFDYWIGDEATSHEEHRPIISSLRKIAEGGTPVFVMHGNRDFLMGAGFERESGCQLMKDPTIIDLYGTRVLLMHGDTLCIDDHEYQAFRREVRNPEWIKNFLGKSPDERDAIILRYREDSKVATAKKRAEIMDVNQKAVEATMTQHGVDNLIHGHTHKPGQHFFNISGRRACRVVLGDWYEEGNVLRCTAEEWLLQRLPLTEHDGVVNTRYNLPFKR